MCHSCEVLNPPDGLFCYNCGTSLTQAERGAKSPELASRKPVPPRSTKLGCPRCHAVNELGSKYCYKCGLPVEDERPGTVVGETAGSVPRLRLPVFAGISLRASADLATGLLATQCIGYGLIILFALRAYGLTLKVGEPRDFTAQWSDGEYLGLALGLVLLMFIAAAVLFLTWMNLASFNLQFLGAQGQRFSPRWAVGWWFVPIMNFFRPYQVMAEIWRGSTPTMLGEMTADWKRGPVPALLGWWWVSWLLSWFATLASVIDEDRPGDQVLLDVVAVALATCAGVLAILIVRRVTAMQEEKHKRMIASAER